MKIIEDVKSWNLLTIYNLFDHLAAAEAEITLLL